ncbi:hypothetical protein [Spongiactinospora sp. TRM90649]|nr:hypothetical protein [Spongiactinospora sp. TRM90649]MDF5757770.1 hypothetical protein [Spongiactinospora sp. TRM90649]
MVWALRHGPMRPAELGRGLLSPIEAFGTWAYEHGDAVLAAQAANGES